MKVFHARGFLLGSKITGRTHTPRQYDGYRLDELTLTTTMTTRADVENVIAYLKIHRFCFDNQGDNAEIITKEMYTD
jgi:hypothetical protein